MRLVVDPGTLIRTWNIGEHGEALQYRQRQLICNLPTRRACRRQ